MIPQNENFANNIRDDLILHFRARACVIGTWDDTFGNYLSYNLNSKYPPYPYNTPIYSPNIYIYIYIYIYMLPYITPFGEFRLPQP